jgi:hypothetical protein
MSGSSTRNGSSSGGTTRVSSSSGGSTGSSTTTGGSTGEAGSSNSSSSGGSTSSGSTSGSSSSGLVGDWTCALPGLSQGFSAVVTYAVGSHPAALAVADFNGDSRTDLAVANDDSVGDGGTVSVLLNSGDGGFAAQVTFNVGPNPNALAVADFNGDGRPDLAVTNSSAATVSVLLNLGGGAFASQVTYSVGSDPSSVAVGDFNGDGKPDLAVTNAAENTIGVLLNLGNGDFAREVTYSVGSYPSSVAVADLSGDGRPDVAVASYVGNSLCVLMGLPDGGFAAAVTYTGVGGGPNGPWSVAAGDFNGDGKPDLAVAILNDPIVSVLMNLGGGILAPEVTYTVGIDASSVAVGDFAGDGTLGLAVANGGSFYLSVLLSQGGNLFSTQLVPKLGTFAAAVAVGDFNGDGRPDLAVANNGAGDAGTVGVLFNLGGGQGGGDLALPSMSPVGQNPRGIAVGDFNQDGELDLAVANNTCVLPDAGPCPDGPGTVSVLLNKGGAVFATQVTYTAENSPAAVAVGDFNGDGWPDLAVANEVAATIGTGTVSVFLNQTDGGFGVQLPYAVGNAPVAIAVADFNADGNADLVVVNFSDATVGLLFGYGDGGFAPEVTFPVGNSPLSVAVGDFDGDGRPDIAVANSFCTLVDGGTCAGTVGVLHNDDGGTFGPQVTFPAGPGAGAIAVGDLNADGKLDLVVGNVADATVSILINLGDGGFASQVTYAVGTGPCSVALPGSVAVGDFNGDGQPDIAAACTDGTLSILLNMGGGTFAPEVTFAAGNYPDAVALGDFNGDGLLDLAVADWSNAQVNVFLNQCQ